MTVSEARLAIAEILPEPHASLAAGIALGVNLDKKTQAYHSLLEAGLIHIVVLSGTNVSLILKAVDTALSGVPKIIRTITSLTTVVVFSIWVGIEPPIFRATCFAVLSHLGSLTGRTPHPAIMLLTTALCALVLKPEWAGSLSFILTYTASSAIMLTGKPSTIERPYNNLVAKVQSYVVNELKTSTAATLATAPIIWFYFGRIQLHGIFSTVAVSWAVVPIMFLGFITIVCQLNMPTIAPLFSYPLKFLLDFVLFVGFAFG